MSGENALLRVQANATRLGGKCADMYFQEVNVTGSWAEAKRAGGYRYSISQRVAETPEWIAFGKVALKVVHGRTASGLLYLNLYVKHLTQSGFAVGGLLGEDDHFDVSIPPKDCMRKLSLVGEMSGQGPSWGQLYAVKPNPELYAIKPGPELYAVKPNPQLYDIKPSTGYM